MNTSKSPKRVVALAGNQGWKNAQLLKDCGVIPYLLYKNHHCDVSMVGAVKGEDYSNLKYIKGIKLEFLPDEKLQTKANYLVREAENIDCLLLYGCYSTYFPLTTVYKQFNPQGKVSLALDANSSWMDSLRWDEPVFRKFMEQCDVITCSGLTMQRHLNEKWPWAIEHIPNGFYNFTGLSREVTFGNKENTILTVARIGTPYKGTNILLESFARIAEQLPDWNLRLVGPVAEEFTDYLNQFWEQYPHLKKRIHFPGNILDRNQLYEEYRNAKIFALPSVFEGGTPNVIAEALAFGNAIALTKIDEYQEAIASGCCGMAAEINDIPGFSAILFEMCQSNNLNDMCKYACQYAQKHFDMERIVAKLYYLIWGDGI